jgi:hypothetical protein
MFSAEPGARPFQFERDTFAFAHELVWQYRFDPVSGQMRTVRASPPPTYYHRCFVMVRAARQFFYHASFNPVLPAPQTEAGRRLIRMVVSRSPRKASAAQDRVEIPGYEGLRAFSRCWEGPLKEECGEAWESYVLRSHWRMVLPIWRGHQRRTAERLERLIRGGRTCVVHLFRFPRITINHGILLFGVTSEGGVVRFEGYDPNIPEGTVRLTYREADRWFEFPRNHYWAGGRLQVVEIYRNWVY